MSDDWRRTHDWGAERIEARIKTLPPRLDPPCHAGNSPDPLRAAGAFWAVASPGH